jgi:hypothetical protein
MRPLHPACFTVCWPCYLYKPPHLSCVPSSHSDLPVFLNLSSLFLVLRITFLRSFSTVLSQVIPPLLHMFYIFPLLCHVFFFLIWFTCVLFVSVLRVSTSEPLTLVVVATVYFSSRFMFLSYLMFVWFD